MSYFWLVSRQKALKSSSALGEFLGFDPLLVFDPGFKSAGEYTWYTPSCMGIYVHFMYE